MDRLKNWIRKYWWVGLLAVVAGVLFYGWKTERSILPSPVIEEVADRALSNADDLDRKLEAIQREVSQTRREVKTREKKISQEVQDLDCVELARRWNIIVANDRQRRISAHGTSQDRGARDLGE